MRWPWSRPEQDAPAGASGPPVEAPAEVARPQAAWSALPPLQRTLGLPTLTSAPGTFAAGLAAWRSAAVTGTVSRQVDVDMPLRSAPSDRSVPSARAQAPAVSMPLVPRLDEPWPQVQRARDGYAGDPPPAPAYPSRPLVTASTAGMPLVQLVAESLPEPAAAATESTERGQSEELVEGEVAPSPGAPLDSVAPAQGPGSPLAEPVVARIVDATAASPARPEVLGPGPRSRGQVSAPAPHDPSADSPPAGSSTGADPHPSVRPDAPPAPTAVTMPIVRTPAPAPAGGTPSIQRHVDAASRPADPVPSPAPERVDPATTWLPNHAGPPAESHAASGQHEAGGRLDTDDAGPVDLGMPVEPEPPHGASDPFLSVVPAATATDPGSDHPVALQRLAEQQPTPGVGQVAPDTASADAAPMAGAAADVQDGAGLATPGAADSMLLPPTPAPGTLPPGLRLGLGAPLTHPAMPLVQRAAVAGAAATMRADLSADRGPSSVHASTHGPTAGAPTPAPGEVPGSREELDSIVALEPLREPDRPALPVVQRRAEPDAPAPGSDVPEPPAPGAHEPGLDGEHASGDAAGLAATGGGEPAPDLDVPAAPGEDLDGLPTVAALALVPPGRPQLTVAPTQRSVAGTADGRLERAVPLDRAVSSIPRVQRLRTGDLADRPVPPSPRVQRLQTDDIADRARPHADEAGSSAWPVATLPRQRQVALDTRAPAMPLGPVRGPSIALAEPDASPGSSALAPLDLPLGIPPAASSALQRIAEQSGATDSDLVRREVVVDLPGPGAGGIPALQRVLEDPHPDASAPSGTGGSSVPTGATGGPSSDEVDALADRLYEPLISRLRADLLVERERHGRLTDRW